MAEQSGLSRHNKPISVPGGDPSAGASHPGVELDDRYHTYESNPVPWWLTVVWVSFLLFGLIYMIVSLLE